MTPSGLDVSLLYQAVSAADHAVWTTGVHVFGYYADIFAVYFCLMSMFVIGGVWAVVLSLCLSERTPGRLVSSLTVFGMILVWSGFPDSGPSVSTLAARDTACSALLNAVSAGEVRTMQHSWQTEVSSACGAAAFLGAANAPSSRYIFS